MFPEIRGLQHYLADPCMLKTDEGYYLIATGDASDGRKLPVYFSEDLQTWEFMRGAVEPGPAGSWNRRNFWAPELYEFDGRYYLYYTAMPDGTPKNIGNRVGVAVGDHPAGPYEDLGVVVPHGSLDGSVFTDRDGTRHLLYTTEVENQSGFPQGKILIDRLVSPSEVAGQPTVVMNRHGWQEGPTLFLRDDRYHLLFSTGGWKGPDYCVRWAVADQLLGPYIEVNPERPLVQTAPGMIGPGHGFMWRETQDDLRYVFHAWDNDMSRRSPRFAKIKWDDGQPSFMPFETISGE